MRVSRLPRAVVLVAALAAMVIVTKLIAEDLLGLDLAARATRWMATPGVGAGSVIVGLLAVDILLPVPSSLVMVASGAVFGTAWGSVLSLVGSIGGEWLGFELVRRYGRRASRRLVGDEELARLNQIFATHGAAAVVITRALPVVMETMSVVAGLSTMPRATFLAASLLGTAPIVVLYAYAGSVSRDAGSVVPAVIMVIAIAGAGWIWYRARVSPTGSRT